MKYKDISIKDLDKKHKYITESGEYDQYKAGKRGEPASGYINLSGMMLVQDGDCIILCAEVPVMGSGTYDDLRDVTTIRKMAYIKKGKKVSWQYREELLSKVMIINKYRPGKDFTNRD